MSEPAKIKFKICINCSLVVYKNTSAVLNMPELTADSEYPYNIYESYMSQYVSICLTL